MQPTDPPPPGPAPDTSPGTSTASPGRRGWLGALPRPCVLCQQWCRAGFCSDCRLRFLVHDLPRCPRCALPSPAAQTCGRCLRTPPPFSHCTTLADYGFPWDRLITRFKFRQQPELAGLLAGALADAIDRQPLLPRPQLVLPVPLSPQRLAERGYNQAWELARRVASALRLPADASLLQRPLETAHQAELGRGERQRNLRTAFMADPSRRSELHGRRVALVDDVMTTGATAREAAAVLLRAGAAAVDLWVLARTPQPA